VYFDTAAFGDQYGKLHPRRQADNSSNDNDECGDKELAGGKKRTADFALWKAQKEGEVTWPSPWGPGRPGWLVYPAVFVLFLACRSDTHTTAPLNVGTLNVPQWPARCLATSSTSTRAGLSVGYCRPFVIGICRIDLCFPHHENEIAQSESAHGVPQWANYFLHSGHVLLHDVKISKSLGNVISIADFLAQHSANHFRIFCLLVKFQQEYVSC
jgi:cysteinyl-tRNA synthetase